MADLNATAKATLKYARVSPEEWARAWYSTDGTWTGDACGCPDNRCKGGFHHVGENDCGCLGVLLEQYLTGESTFACAVTAKLGGTTYQCRDHPEDYGLGGAVHRFALHWPACPAPWCQLKPGHSELHDVPSGKPEIIASSFGRNRRVAELRALTVRQPWAWAIAEGHKLVENRSWKTNYRGLLAIHAGSKLESFASSPEAFPLLAQPAPESRLMGLGCIVAVATLSGIHYSDKCMLPAGPPEAPGMRSGCSLWAMHDEYHWTLADVRPLAEPVPCKGKLGLWRLPGDVEDQVRAQLKEPESA